jgi:hypothetical protein
MRHYITSILLLSTLSLGVSASNHPARLDKTIFERYQNQTSTTSILPKQSIDQAIDQLYMRLPPNIAANMVERLYYFSEHYLHSPYILFPLGEGPLAEYDQMPRARLDGFDCQTYVDTILALTIAKDAKNFRQCLDKIRYRNGEVSFITRNHFTSLDWNKNNQAQGYLQDITVSIRDEHKKSVAMYASTQIDKAGWYQKLPQSFIRVPSLSPKERALRLEALHSAGQQFKPEQIVLPYIPLNTLIQHNKTANTFVLKQIPSGSIIEIVRPHWKLKSVIGTDLDVSHLGFVFWKNNVLYFREASSMAHEVIDIPLVDYLNELSKNPTIGGINIQVIQIKTPLPSCY